MKIVIDSEITEETAAFFCEQIQDIAEGEQLEIEISSEGGSVTAGNIIVSKIRDLSKSGHQTTAHVISLAASMASVIACACDNLIIDSNAFLMIHCVWSCVQGNAEQLRKEADTLDLFTKSLISVYRSKFDKTDEEIMAYLQAETWILGEQAHRYGLKCTVNSVGAEIKIAAKVDLSKFKNLPKVFNMEKEEEKKTEEILEEENKENIEKALEEQPEEQPEEQKPTYEELEQKIEELEAKLAEYEKDDEDEDEDVVTKDECEKRVSGMQASMQKQVNDFKNQLTAKDGELTEAKALVTSLESELEKAKSELSKTASALADKENALAELNAGVNKPAEQKFDPNGWRNLKGQAFWDFLKKHPEVKNQK